MKWNLWNDNKSNLFEIMHFSFLNLFLPFWYNLSVQFCFKTSFSQKWPISKSLNGAGFPMRNHIYLIKKILCCDIAMSNAEDVTRTYWVHVVVVTSLCLMLKMSHWHWVHVVAQRWHVYFTRRADNCQWIVCARIM